MVSVPVASTFIGRNINSRPTQDLNYIHWGVGPRSLCLLSFSGDS